MDCTINKDDIEKLYKQIGINVKMHREAAGLTQLELSQLIGHKAVGTISMAELYINRKHFNIEHLAKIANVLNIEITEFFK